MEETGKMKKTRLLICLALVFVMLFGAVQAFATEETTDTTETTEAVVDTAAPATDETCSATGGAHEFQDGWKTSTEEHWHYCLKCKKKVGIEKHEFGEADANYQMTCKECAKKVDVPHVHSPAAEWSKNAYTHWHKCEATYGLKGATFCKEKNDEAEHTYGEDGLCTVCGAEDVVPEERPGDAGIKWVVVIVIAVVGVAAGAAVFLIKKKN